METEDDARVWYQGLTQGTKRDLRDTAPECRLSRDLGVAAGAGARKTANPARESEDSAPLPGWQERYELWPWARFVVVEDAFNLCHDSEADSDPAVAPPGYITRRYEALRVGLAQLGSELGKGVLLESGTVFSAAEWDPPSKGMPPSKTVE